MTTWKSTYLENWKPISIENHLTEELEECYPPIIRRMAGRPKKKRAQKGDRGLAALTYAK